MFRTTNIERCRPQEEMPTVPSQQNKVIRLDFLKELLRSSPFHRTQSETPQCDLQEPKQPDHHFCRLYKEQPYRLDFDLEVFHESKRGTLMKEADSLSLSLDRTRYL